MNRHTARFWRLSFVAVALAIAATACTSSNADDEPQSKGKPLQTKPVAEVLQLVQARAQAVADSVGSPIANWSTNTVPCEGQRGEIADDGRWYLGASANLRVAPADQLATLARVREALRQQGYEITEDRTFADAPGVRCRRVIPVRRSPSSSLLPRASTTWQLVS